MIIVICMVQHKHKSQNKNVYVSLVLTDTLAEVGGWKIEEKICNIVSIVCAIALV